MHYPRTRTRITPLRDLPLSERPREKILQNGPSSLTDGELLAILLGTGNRGEDALQLAERILPLIDGDRSDGIIWDLISRAGLGPARSMRIRAAHEFFRRRIRPEGIQVRNPGQVYDLVKHFSDRRQEHFISLTLNGGGELIRSRVVSIGLVDRTPVHPREVFAGALSDLASSIIVAHNHPSGRLEPSPEDIQITDQLEDAGQFMGIRLLDHVIFTRNGFFSLREGGHLNPGSDPI